MNDIATNEELRGIAQRIKTRGLSKALRALEETRRRNRATANGGKRTYCAMCDEYGGNIHCATCPVGIELNGDICICYRVIRVRPLVARAKAAADVCRDLARYVRAEIKRRAGKKKGGA